MSQWDSLIQASAQKWNVDPRLIASVVQTESHGDPAAYNSEYGATGLGQQIPATAKALGIDPKDPAQSIDGVARLLDQNLTRYGNPQQAILAYHGGTDQSAWGPKTQDYLSKVSANYGAPQVAKTSAVPDQDFEAAFGVRPSASAPAPTGQDPFEASFGARPGAQAAPQTAAASAPAPAATGAPSPGKPSPSFLDTAAGLVNDFGAQSIRNANSIGRGISDVFDAPSEWVAAGAEKSGLTGLLGKAGINMPTADQQVQLNAQSRADYAARNPDGGFQDMAGRIGGNILGVMTPIAGAEAGLTKGGQVLSNALGNPEALAKAGQFISGQGGLGSRMAYNAAQGAAGGALLSGGQPDSSLGESAGLGALMGGAVPVVGSAIKNGVGALRSAIDPFTEAGQGRVAQSILERAAGKGPTTPDLAQYVPGSTPTLAQATGNPMLASMERETINRAPIEFGAIKDSNNAARMDYLNSIRGTPDTLKAAIASRDQQALPLLDAAMTNTKPTNPQPVIDTIDQILASPQGQRDSVTNALNSVKAKIGSGDTAQTDPAQLYGIRKSIADQLENVGGRDNSAAQQASSQLQQVRDSLDSVIEQGAPGFGNYLKQYADMSKPINAQNYLQKLDMTDQTGQALTLNKFKNQLSAINKLRAAPGANDAKAITDDQLQALGNIQQDLLRESNSVLKGRSPGSNTGQNLAMNNMMQTMMPGPLGRLSLAPEGIGGALGWALGGPAGSGMGVAAGNGLRQAMAAQNPAIEARLIELLTDPATKLSRANSGSGNTLLNRLSGPAGGSVATQGSNNNR